MSGDNPKRPIIAAIIYFPMKSAPLLTIVRRGHEMHSIDFAIVTRKQGETDVSEGCFRSGKDINGNRGGRVCSELERR